PCPAGHVVQCRRRTGGEPTRGLRSNSSRAAFCRERPMRNKIVAMEEVEAHTARLRENGRKVVFTNGCFDLLHVGHVRYLQRARSRGDLLVVGLNADASVRALKGEGRPINREHDRAEVLAALESVDLVTIFPETRATRFIEA